MYKKITSIVIILFLISVLFACDSDNDNGQSSKGKSDLTIYVYSSFTDNLKNSIKSYMKDNHGIDTVFEVFEDTGPMVTTIIREKDNPKADLVIGVDNSFGLDILDAGVLVPYKPKNIRYAKSNLVFDNTYNLIPFDYGFVTINYNSEKLKDTTIPKSMKDLSSNIYEKRLALISPLTSSTGRIFLFETIARYGEDGYLNFWKSIKPSITNITSGWSDAYYGLYVQGESDLVISYSTSPAVHVIYDNTDKYKSILFDDKAYIQVEACGIIKNSGNVDFAKLAVDYILSKDFQEMIPDNQFMYPVNAEADIPEVFRKYAPVPSDTMLLETAYIKDNIDKWLEDWERLMMSSK